MQSKGLINNISVLHLLPTKFFQSITNFFDWWPAIRVKSLQVALVTPTFADGKIAWKQDGEWLTLQSYVADHMICDLPCSILSCLLRAMKLTGHQKLSHPLKVEFFLRHMGKSDEEIAVALSLLKVRTRKKQDSEAKEEGEQADGEDRFFSRWKYNSTIGCSIIVDINFTVVVSLHLNFLFQGMVAGCSKESCHTVPSNTGFLFTIETETGFQWRWSFGWGWRPKYSWIFEWDGGCRGVGKPSWRGQSTRSSWSSFSRWSPTPGGRWSGSGDDWWPCSSRRKEGKWCQNHWNFSCCSPKACCF